MKHPVNTSTWGVFKVGELFETNGKKTFTGASVNKNKLSDGGTPRITVTEKTMVYMGIIVILMISIIEFMINSYQFRF